MRQLTTLMSNTPIADSVADSASDLTYKPIAGNPINRTFKVKKAMLCHVGPDPGWPVLRPFLEATQQKLSVAMYDFNADYVVKCFIETVRDKNLKAVLTWDDGMTAPETTIRTRLRSKLEDKLDGAVIAVHSWGRRIV